MQVHSLPPCIQLFALNLNRLPCRLAHAHTQDRQSYVSIPGVQYGASGGFAIVFWAQARWEAPVCMGGWLCTMCRAALHRHAVHGKGPCIYCETPVRTFMLAKQSCIHAQAPCHCLHLNPYAKADALGQWHLV